MSASKRSGAQFNPATGRMVNPQTGEDIKPGDPLWQPEWGSVINDLHSIPSGQHYVYPTGGDHPETRYLARNDVPWYRDPALIGAIAMPAAAATIPGLTTFEGIGAGTGAGTGAGAGEFGFSSVPASTGGMAANTAAGATGSATGGGMGWGSAIKTGLDYYNKYGDIAQRLGEDASAMGQGRAAGRVQQAGLNNNQDALKLRAAQLMEDALQGRAGLDLKQREFALQAPGMRASNSARGDALAGLQDVGVSGPTIHTHGQIPQITGGLRPSLLSANTRQLGSNMSRDALLQNMTGADTFQPLPPVNVPTITPMPQGNGLDTALNGLGLAGGLGGDIMDFVNKYKSRQQPQATGGGMPPNWQDEGMG